MSGRTRMNYNLRLSPEELALLKEAAQLRGFSSWSAYLRYLGVNDARQTCAEHGFAGAPNPNVPTLWDAQK